MFQEIGGVPGNYRAVARAFQEFQRCSSWDVAGVFKGLQKCIRGFQVSSRDFLSVQGRSKRFLLRPMKMKAVSGISGVFQGIKEVFQKVPRAFLGFSEFQRL